MTVNVNKETRSFETEVKQLLHIVIHSLYSNKEIFLRELISNASDAIDKLRFAALTKSELYEKDSDLKVIINFDEKAKTITVTDNGIGMDREEVINNIGTIAKSGTKEFLANLTGDQAKDSNLIGQFGVGFYSAFVVADKVTVKSRRAGLQADQGVLWSSSGDGDYVIETIEKPQRGTEITLHIKKGEEEFLSDWRLRSIITKYSDHISWPVLMKKQKAAEETAEPEKADDKKSDEKKGDDQKTEAKAKAKKSEEKVEFESVNKATALWTMQKSDISDEQYQELYKHISHDFQNPLLWVHNHVEGRQHYISLLYIPSQAPYDMWNQEFKHGLKLYIKRVFVMDDAAQFLPRYLRFVKGIIDSSDLPLNISREILQDNKLVEVIRKSCVKRTLDMLQKTANKDPEKYQKFWEAFGLVLKEGPIEDFENRDKVAKLLRFASTNSNEAKQNVSLDDYVKRMKEGQDKIYYMSASSFNTAKHSPHLEIFRDKGIEVILLYDRIDEWLVSHVTEYDGKQLQSVTKGELDLSGIDSAKDKGKDEKEEKGEDKAAEKDEQKFESLIKQIKEILGDKVKEVRSTKRLTTSPACIVADQNDMGLEMQRIMQAAGQPAVPSKPIFELNLEHPLVAKLNNETDDDRLAQWSEILFEQAMLAEGGQLEDPAEFVNRLNKMLLELAQ